MGSVNFLIGWSKFLANQKHKGPVQTRTFHEPNLIRPIGHFWSHNHASFKQCVEILPKLDRAHKNYLTPEIWEETHVRETFYCTLIFQQSSMICISHHVKGHTLALQQGGKNYLLLVSCKTFDSYAQKCCKCYHIIFSTFSLKFKCKICV